MSAAPPFLITPLDRIERKLQLRDYQREMHASYYDAIGRGRQRLLGQLPTGGGKTVVFGHLTADALERGGESVLVLAHRDELITQAVDKLRDIIGDAVPIGVVKAERDECDAPLVVGSVQTLARDRRLARLPDTFQLVIVDEAHHAAADSYQRILDHVGGFDRAGPNVVGFTATPDRGDGVGLDGTFEEIFFERSILDLMRVGWLTDIAAHQVAVAGDFTSLHTRAGDVIASEAGDLLLAAKAPDTVARAIAELAPERKTIVFTPTVAVAHAVAAACQEHGLAAAGLDGETPFEERRAIIARLRAGELQVVANCMVLTEGFDDPSVDCIVIARPTRSRSLYAQMIGRGLRPYPGKQNCQVIDCVGSTLRHDLVTPASLFGLRSGDLTAGTVMEAIAARERTPADDWGGDAPRGDLVMAPVDLFRQRPITWVPVTNGRFALSTGRGLLIVRPTFGDRWDVIESVRGTPARPLVSDLSLGAATGYAEDHVRSLGAGALIDRNAAWRQDPPSEKQLRALRRFGVPLASIRTRGDASDALSAAIVSLEVA